MTEIEAMIQVRGQDGVNGLPKSAMDNLVRFTASYADNHVRVQLVINEETIEDDWEEYSCIFTEILADFSTATGDENTIRVRSADEASSIKELPIAIYP